ncbi:MAG TPA: alkaline phosphatase family protein [Steroidobacteraceae bacterium]|nr:alkaline phosphatase family protein [Steroidobacteraceae bacterium]
MKRGSLLALGGVGVLLAGQALASPNNLILFVPDGLRAPIVDAATAPTLARLRDEGVNFRNSHSLYPTFTTANASALATGHLLGDTGDWANTLWTGLPFEGSVTPYLENERALRQISLHFGGSYLNEPSIIGAAASLSGASQISTALIGKVGPVAIFNLGALAGTDTLIVDDNTGQADKGIPVTAEWRQLIADSKIHPADAPPRSDNGKPGTFIANLSQTQYFLEITLKVVLPEFKRRGRPFVLVYWSRDPDGTQHTQGDGGINGPTSMTALRSADGALAAIEQTLKALQLYDSTNIVVAADHGFSTIAKDSENGARQLPVGFLAADLARGLNLKLFDPDDDDKPIDPSVGGSKVANGVIGDDPRVPQVVVAANGGSDLVYLPTGARTSTAERTRVRKLGQKVVQLLLARDYVSGLFVDESTLGRIDGTLTLQDIGLLGKAVTLRPSIVVNFRSYVPATCDRKETTLCALEISDHTYPAGGGMHGAFSRADTWNFMAARGPDFRDRMVDELPASNADIGATLAKLLELDLKPKGPLSGRVLTESLRGHESDILPPVLPLHLESRPAANGLKTILEGQTLGVFHYYDAAGFAGRTVGLDARTATARAPAVR